MARDSYTIVFDFAYCGGVAEIGINTQAFGRGLIARRVAEWCGVDLSFHCI